MVSSRDDEPVNLLALDGGGVRGVSSLAILHEIMKTLQDEASLSVLPRPCDYFHLIGGTSTGGLIAIMLGRLQMTTQEALDQYDSFAKNIFSRRNKKLVSMSDRFRASTLREAVEELVTSRKGGELMRQPDPSNNRCKAFVCAMPVMKQGDPIRFRTYEVDHDRYKKCKIWEAARATSAAPRYFKPVTICSDTGELESFIDGAMGYNNPVEWVTLEAAEVFNRSRKLGCVVSIGTGTRDKALERSKAGLMNLYRTVNLLKEITTDTERSHRFMDRFVKEFPGVYFRFNVPNGADEVDLDDYTKIESLKAMTKTYIQGKTSQDIHKIAHTLRTKSTAGLTIGHIGKYSQVQLRLNISNQAQGSLSQAQVVKSLRHAQPRGRASDLFTGRFKILNSLKSFFAPREPGSGPRRQFLMCGMGGAGKTQIALKFVEDDEASKSDRRFSCIFWIDATDEVTIEQSYKNIAVGLGLNGADSNPVPKVLQWLKQSNEEWLLVLDSCSNKDFSRFIPPGNKGNILYTARDQHLKQVVRGGYADVNEMERLDSVTLLLKAANEAPDSPERRTIAEPIVEDLGFLPLAIDQAGAYIFMKSCPLEEYLGIFHKQKQTMLERPHFKGASQSNQAVYATFELSYDALLELFTENRHSPEGEDARYAMQILNMICFYHYQSMMIETVKRAAEFRHEKIRRREDYPLGEGDHSLENLVGTDDAGVWESESFENGCDLLGRFSLVKLDKNGTYISMHILVHSWARDRMDDETKRHCSVTARQILFESIPYKYTGEDAYTYRRRMVPHVMACLENATFKHPDELLESEYDGIVARVTKEAGLLDAAESALKRVLRARIYEYGRDHWKATLFPMADLARVYKAQGRYADSATLFLEVIERREGERKGKNEDHPTVLCEKRDLAHVYVMLGQSDALEQIMTDMFEAEERTNAENRQYRWPSIQFQAALAHERAAQSGQRVPLEEVERLFTDAVRLLGPRCPATMSVKASLGRALAKEKQFREAEQIYLEVYEYFRDLRGEYDRSTIKCLELIGDVLLHQRRGIEAESVYRAALACSQSAFGVDHPETLMILYGLIGAFMFQGRLVESLGLMERCVELMETKVGPHQILVGEVKDVLEILRQQRSQAPCLEFLRGRATHEAWLASKAVLGNTVTKEQLLAGNTRSEGEEPEEWVYYRPPDQRDTHHSCPLCVNGRLELSIAESFALDEEDGESQMLASTSRQ